MIELGIIPAVTRSDFYTMVHSLCEDDRRKLNRKFRKVWRKIAKTDPSMAKFLGLGLRNPESKYIKRRLAIVVSRISGLIDAIPEDQHPVPIQPW